MNPIINIAIADDDLLFRQGVASLFKNYKGINLLIKASNGLELLENLKKTKIDVVLLDVDMPVMNGCDTLKIIKELYPELKVIILGSHYDDECVLKVIIGGAVSYLTKSLDIDQIVDAIYTVNSHGYYFNTDVSLIMAQSIKDQKNIIGQNDEEFLTLRERGVLELLCQELNTSEIADRLMLSKRTVETHRKSLMNKTHSKNLIGLFNYALSHNIIKKSA